MLNMLNNIIMSSSRAMMGMTSLLYHFYDILHTATPVEQREWRGGLHMDPINNLCYVTSHFLFFPMSLFAMSLFI